LVRARLSLSLESNFALSALLMPPSSWRAMRFSSARIFWSCWSSASPWAWVRVPAAILAAISLFCLFRRRVTSLWRFRAFFEGAWLGSAVGRAVAYGSAVG